MGDPIDTGPGGFDVDGKTYTYDVGASEKDGGDQGPRHKTVDVSAGYQDSSGNPKDLTKKTKATLGQYLSDVTSGKRGAPANRYPVSAQPQGERNLSNKDGSPTGPTPVDAASTNHFVDSNEVQAYTQQYPDLKPHLRKGKESGVASDAVDGNDLLRKKQSGTNNDTTPLGKYQSAVMTTNRFSAASGATYGDQSSNDEGFDPGLTKQSTKGKFDPAAQVIALGRLANIGPLLTMRAGKELGAASGGADPNSAALQAGALLPGLGQLGVTRIDPTVLTAADVLSNLTTNEPDGVFVISPSGLSWGQLNNVDDPFSGTDALGMLALSTALVAGLELLIDGLSLLLGLITPQAKHPTRDPQGRYSLGEYFQGSKQSKKAASGGIGGALSALSSLNFGALLGIQPTNYPFSMALKKGANAFFGIDDSGGVLGQLAGALSSSADSPGFNVVVARTIIRSSITIVDQLKKIGGNVLNAITQILALIDTIRNSKLIAACNVFATLGDAILTLPSDWVDGDASGGVKISQIDQMDDDLTNAVMKNRLKGNLKLAWASNRSAANLLLPTNIISAASNLSSMGAFSLDGTNEALSKVQRTGVDSSMSARISPEDAAKFESVLEAEYVPFYFHDIRTNEMIGFHAFLASLNDDYTAAFEKSDGIGRVEPVKIYKGTERRIALSFYIAATSMNDFDEMWLKINKLVTLVYPQYTSGVQVQNKDGTYKFTQPFSQLVGASPLVRIRLGDLFKSNYSRFALARLFGLGNKDFTLNSKTAAKDGIDGDVMQQYSQALRDALDDPKGETYYVAPGTYKLAGPDDKSGGGGIGVSISVPNPLGGGGGAPDNAPEFKPQAAAVSGLLIVKAKSSSSNPTQVICTVTVNDDPDFTQRYGAAVGKAEAEYKNDKKIQQKYLDGDYVIPKAALTPTSKTKKTILQKVVPGGDDSFSTELVDFMKADGPSGNVIAKSFRDTGGKGLAGFIESMNFDWYDKVTWEIHPDRTAPKLCKVTISFSPIHDISPGLDHNGFNRAPVYPIGLLAPAPDSSNKGND